MIVPENIFDIAPQIKNILQYQGLGGQFKGFQNKSQFSISITFELSNQAYYNDEKLIINNQVLDYNNIGNMVLNGYGKVGKLSDLVILDIGKSISKETLDKLEDDINTGLEFAEAGTQDPSELPNCPELTQDEKDEISELNTTTVNIENADAEIISSVTMDLSDNSKICKTSTGLEESLKATFLNSLPKIDPGNDIEPKISEPLCSLPDNSELKVKVQEEMQKLDVTDSTIGSYNNALLDDGISKELQKQLQIIEDDTGININDTSTEVIMNSVDSILENSLPTYGIPLLQINLDANIIIQINDGNLEVLNFDKYIDGQSILEDSTNTAGTIYDTNLNSSVPDIGKQKLEIKYLDSGNENAKIIPEVIYTMVYTRKFNYHSIELKRFYGEEVFKDEETSTIETGLYYLGMDKSGLKQFCGKIYDVHLQQDPIDINNITFGQNYFPDLYGALAYYDFFNKSEDETRIKYNRVYPYKSLGKPLSVRGQNWYLESRKAGNYTFPNHSIIDDMFCKNKFTNKSFNIIFFFKRNAFMDPFLSLRNEEYDISRQVIISDPVNNNCIYYNERDMTLNIDFHGYHSEIFINFVPGQWYQTSLKYDYEKQEFKTEVYWKNLEAASEYEFLSTSSTRKVSSTMELDKIDINDLDAFSTNPADNKRFQLNSFFAEYSFSSKGYIKPFNTLCGPIILYDKCLDDMIISGIFESFYPVLNYYKDVGGVFTENGILYNY
jgi:hypothetical protein